MLTHSQDGVIPRAVEESEITNLAKAVLYGGYDLEVLSPFDEKAALEEVRQDIKDLLALNNPETRHARHNYFKIPGTTESDYIEKLFELASSKVFLAGIRHAGGDPKLPFVNVTLGFELTMEELPKIVSLLSTHYEPFRPLHFSVWTKSRFESIWPINKFKPAQRFLANKISELDLSDTSDSPIELRLIEDASYYPWYEKEYRAFHDLNPALKSWVTASEKEDLEKYRSQGLLYKAYLNGDLIGLIGGENRQLLGLSGIYIGELLISQAHRGKGLAVPMQRQFLEHVGNNVGVVWGTIDARNVSSTRTAMRVGRRPMRTEYFIY